MLRKENFVSPKNDSPSYISDLGQSKPAKSKLLLLVKMILAFQIFWIQHNQKLWKEVTDPAKNAKKPIFYYGSCQNNLKDKPKVYKDICVACDICDVCMVSLQMCWDSKRKRNK